MKNRNRFKLEQMLQFTIPGRKSARWNIHSTLL